MRPKYQVTVYRIIGPLVLFYLNYLPVQIWTLNICNPDILKTIIGRSFKLGQLIDDDK